MPKSKNLQRPTKPEKPRKTKKCEVMQQRLKCFLFATEVFKGRGKSLDFIGFLGRQRRIYTFGKSDRNS